MDRTDRTLLMTKRTDKKPVRLRDSVTRLAMPALSLAIASTAIILSAAEGTPVNPADLSTAAETSLLSMGPDWPW